MVSVSFLAVGLFLAGCGPGQLLGPTITPTPTSTNTPTPTSTNTPTPTTPVVTPTPSSVNLPFMMDESGWVTQNGLLGTGSRHAPQAGDLNNAAVVRGFLSFDLTGMPGNAIVHSAKLILPDPEVLGEPFPSFGSLKFEALWYGLSLAPAAYGTPGYLTLQNTYGGPGPVIGVTAGVEEAISQGYRRFQIRFNFSRDTDGDRSADEYIIPVHRDEPILEVVYILP